MAAVARLEFVQSSSLGLFLDTIGYSIGTLLFPVLSAFIAFSMAGRMALVAGFTGGVMADMASAGVIGALLNGFVGGGVSFVVARVAQKYLKGHDAMFALLVYPLAGAVLTTLIAQFVTNLPAALLDNLITGFINNANTLTLVIVGMVLAGMMSADMGGPFNKISYATGVLLLADCLPENGPGSMVMAAVMLGGMVPPMAAGLASKLIAPHRFSQKERNLGWQAMLKGVLFITEGVIPYLVVPRMRAACVIGSATAGGISMLFRCGVAAPHGGVFLMPIAINPLHYVGAFVVGSLVGALCFTALRPQTVESGVMPRVKKVKVKAAAAAEAPAVTAAPAAAEVPAVETAAPAEATPESVPAVATAAAPEAVPAESAGTAEAPAAAAASAAESAAPTEATGTTEAAAPETAGTSSK